MPDQNDEIPDEVLPGKRFARFTVISVLDGNDALARCDCGQHKVVRRSDLARGLTKSCGCYRRERAGGLNRSHAETRTRMYRVWEAMLNRTRRTEQYPTYAQRGIHVHAEWVASYEAFRDHVRATIGDCPVGGTLDRIDNDRGYEPGNLRWASSKTQANNRSSNVHLTVKGVTRTLAEWSDLTGISQQVIYQRRKRGWSDELAVTAPARDYGKKGRTR